MADTPPFGSELRPRDFVARVPRRAGGIATSGRRKHLGRRALALIAAIAVPAFAAPSDWQALAVGDAGKAEVIVEPMPFEKSGDSFPGSAFYYLAPDDTAAVIADAGVPDAQDGMAGGYATAVARALRITGNAGDQDRALTCLTQAIYYEAASEPDAGQRAVAQVIMNRVAHPAFPNSVCGVVYQGSERSTGCQFTFTCDGALSRVPARLFWQRAQDVARAALAGYVYAPVGLATHYHTIAVHPRWDQTMTLVQTIGAHQFFNLLGPAGSAGAFRNGYAGNEFIPSPRLRAVGPAGPDPSLDPAAIERAYAGGLKVAQDGSPISSTNGIIPLRPAAAPSYSAEVQSRGGDKLYRGEKLPPAQGIRPEYQNSGKWIAQPGT